MKTEQIKAEAEALIELHSCVIINGIKFDNPIPATIEHAIKTQERVIIELEKVNSKILIDYQEAENIDEEQGFANSSMIVKLEINHNKEILTYLKTLI